MTPVRAPAGAVCWSPADGWIHDEREAQRALETNGWALVTASDGYVHIGDDDTTPLAAMLRVDGDLTDVVQRLADLGETVAGVDTGETVDVNELRARVTALAHRVARLEGAAT